MSKYTKTWEKDWTKEQLDAHIKANSDYSSSVVIGALYYKLYGEYPKIGLSGFQAEAIDCLIELLPNKENLK